MPVEPFPLDCPEKHMSWSLSCNTCKAICTVSFGPNIVYADLLEEMGCHMGNSGAIQCPTCSEKNIWQVWPSCGWDWYKCYWIRVDNIEGLVGQAIGANLQWVLRRCSNNMEDKVEWMSKDDWNARQELIANARRELQQQRAHTQSPQPKTRPPNSYEPPNQRVMLERITVSLQQLHAKIDQMAKHFSPDGSVQQPVPLLPSGPPGFDLLPSAPPQVTSEDQSGGHSSSSTGG